jgi:hypothetical protein
MLGRFLTSFIGCACVTALVGLGACSANEKAEREKSNDDDIEDLDSGMDLVDGGDNGPVVNGGPVWEYFDEGNKLGYKDDSLPDNVRDLFDGSEDATLAPVIAYPLNASMHPMNLSDIRFMWTRAAETQTIFRVDVVASDIDYQFFVPCEVPEGGTVDQCVIEMPSDDWLDLAVAQAGKDVTVKIASSDGEGGAVGMSAPIALSFSGDPVRGALYYWEANTGTIKRATFGARTAVPFIAPKSDTNEYECASCHSVSRNGKVIAFAVSADRGENVAAIQVAPTEDPTNPYVKPESGTTPYTESDANLTSGGSMEDQPIEDFGQIVALNPDGKLAAINGTPETNPHWPAYFEIRDARTGESVVRYPTGSGAFGGGALAIHPEWSPDGEHIVVAMVPPDDPQIWTSKASKTSIAVLDIADKQIVGARTVVQYVDGGPANYYPSWSPDGQWIVFASGIIDATRVNSLSNWNSVLRLVRATGGPYTCPSADCVELELGTQYGLADAMANAGKHSTWPKFTPFTVGQEGNIMFVSFTSGINYGFLTSSISQLWMFAVDVSKVGTADPSYAPFWLPYQAFDGGSLTPYWTEQLPCRADPEGGCKGCVDGEECIFDKADNCTCHANQIK